MLLEKIESVALDAPFAKKREDVQDGDIVKIVSDAKKQPDRFNPGNMQTIIKVATRNGEKYVALNQTSINILISTFGTNDAAQWKGNDAKILLKPGVFAGKKGIALYLVGPGWELDEFGAPVNPGAEVVEPEIPIIEGDEINIDEVPF